jgi:hypothetical protein
MLKLIRYVPLVYWSMYVFFGESMVTRPEGDDQREVPSRLYRFLLAIISIIIILLEYHVLNDEYMGWIHPDNKRIGVKLVVREPKNTTNHHHVSVKTPLTTPCFCCTCLQYVDKKTNTWSWTKFFI